MVRHVAKVDTWDAFGWLKYIWYWLRYSIDWYWCMLALICCSRSTRGYWSI